MLGIRAVDRPRLHAMFEANRPGLVAIIAPAGYGKTTLASTWASAAGNPVAWITLDAGDDRAALIASNIGIALKRAGHEVGSEFFQLASRPDVAPIDFGRAVAAEIDRLQGPVALVMDDAHLVPVEELQPVLEGLTEHRPPGLQLVLTSRVPLPLPVTRWVAAGRAVVIEADALAFDDAEAGDLLRAIAPGTEDRAAELRAQVEGWPAALSLAGLQIASGRDRGNDLARYSLGELVEEAILLQPGEVQSLLMRLAVVESVTPAFASAMAGTGLGEGDAARLLDDMAALNMLVQRFGANRSIYRFHPLFREHLLDRLGRQEGAGGITRAATAAAVWLGEHGEVDAAIDAWLVAGDREAAADLVGRVRSDTLTDDRWRDLERWLAHLGDEIVATRPELLVGYAYVALRNGQVAAMQEAAARATDLLAALPGDDPALFGVRADLDTLRYMVEFATSLIPAPKSELDVSWLVDPAAPGHEPSPVIALTAELVPPILERLPQSHQATRAHLLNHRVVASIAEGRYGKALALARDSAPDGGLLPGTMAIRTLQAELVAHFLHGAFASGLETADRFHGPAIEAGIVVAAHWVCSLASFCALRLDDPIRALEWAGRAEALRADAHWNSDRLAHTVIALARHRIGAIDGSGDPVAPVRESSLTYVSPLYLVNAEAFSARLAMLAGNRAAVADWLERQGSFGQADSMILADIPAITLARALITVGGEANIARAEETIASVATVAGQLRHVPSRVELLTLAALLRNAQGRPDDATAALRAAVRLAEPGGDRWPFIEGATSLRPLLAAISAGEPDWGYPRVLLDAMTRIPGADRSATQRRLTAALHAGLTAREVEVLALLNGNASIGEIGRMLYIAPATVKRHASSIYTKLGASNRREAVIRGIELGIL